MIPRALTDLTVYRNLYVFATVILQGPDGRRRIVAGSIYCAATVGFHLVAGGRHARTVRGRINQQIAMTRDVREFAECKEKARASGGSMEETCARLDLCPGVLTGCMRGFPDPGIRLGNALRAIAASDPKEHL
jgi:hypothetical protein